MTEPSSEPAADVDALRTDGFSRDFDAPLEQDLFDIAVTQGVSVVEPDGVPDDGERESVAGQLLIDRRLGTLPQQLARS